MKKNLFLRLFVAVILMATIIGSVIVIIFGYKNSPIVFVMFSNITLATGAIWVVLNYPEVKII